jgi:hypothetical protein
MSGMTKGERRGEIQLSKAHSHTTPVDNRVSKGDKESNQEAVDCQNGGGQVKRGITRKRTKNDLG